MKSDVARPQIKPMMITVRRSCVDGFIVSILIKVIHEVVQHLSPCAAGGAAFQAVGQELHHGGFGDVLFTVAFGEWQVVADLPVVKQTGGDVHFLRDFADADLSLRVGNSHGCWWFRMRGGACWRR